MATRITLLLLMLYLSCTECQNNCSTTIPSLISHERDLMRCLNAGYDKAIRPVAKSTDTLNVTINMMLLQILKLDEHDQTLEANGWMQLKWTDSQLKWDKSQYNNIDHINIPTDRIWTPDIVLLNTAERKESFVIGHKHATVDYNGNVIWVPHMRLKAYCKFDLHRFPFDTQDCKFLIGSWTYDKTKMEVHEPSETIRKFAWDTREWDITEYYVTHKTYSFTRGSVVSAVDTYPYLMYTLVMERQGVFYGTVLVAPAVLMAVLILCTFIIPPECNERIGLGVGIVITLTLVMTVVDDYMPTEISEMPLLFMYILFDLIMATLSIVVSVIVLNCSQRSVRKERVPVFIRKVLLGKVKAMCCIRQTGYNTITLVDSGHSTEASGLRASESIMTEQELEMPLPKSQTMALDRVLDDIRMYLRDLSGRGPSNGNQAASSMGIPNMPSHQELLLEEWRLLALVIDRVMFWLFLVITVIVSLAILSH